MNTEEQTQANSAPLDEGVIVTGPVPDFPRRRPALAPALLLAALSGGFGTSSGPRGLSALPSLLPPPEPKPRFTRQPGILDRISSCESSEAAHLMFHEFLDSANAVSQKTINRAKKLLATLDFPLP